MRTSINAGIEYQTLFANFLSGGLPATEFQREYLDRFKNEKNHLTSSCFDLLETVFGEVDSYSTDSALLTANPAFYLDETRLRERIQVALARLLILNRNG